MSNLMNRDHRINQLRLEANMKSIAIITCWAIAAGVILYAAVNPNNGIIWQSPMSAFGVGLIGLGLCKHAHDKQQQTN